MNEPDPSKVLSRDEMKALLRKAFAKPLPPGETKKIIQEVLADQAAGKLDSKLPLDHPFRKLAREVLDEFCKETEQRGESAFPE